MPKDYAKRNTRGKAKSKPRQKSKAQKNRGNSHWKLWLFTILATALFIFVLLHLGRRQVRHRVASYKQEYRVTKLRAPIVERSTRTKAAVSQPKFDFYSVLPKEQVKVSLAPKNGIEYILQVAIVHKYAEADRLKAELALLGFDAYIDKVKVKGQELSRVNVGPYFSKAAAEADQQRLQQNKVKSELRQEK